MPAAADHSSSARPSLDEQLEFNFRAAILLQDIPAIHHLLLAEPLLLASALPIASSDHGRLSPLSFAAWNNRAESVAALIAYGAPPQAEAFALAAGCTPLMIAARGIDGIADAMVATLLPLSNPNQQDACGRTALHHAIEDGEDLRALASLAQATDLRIKDFKGLTPMLLAKLASAFKRGLPAEALIVAEVERRALLALPAAPASVQSKVRL